MIRVLIAEDMHMIRGALVALLKLEPDIEVVAELDRGDDDSRDGACGRTRTSRWWTSTCRGSTA